MSVQRHTMQDKSPIGHQRSERTSPSYFVVMIDCPAQRRREAVVDPEMTYSDVVARAKSGEYDNILFVHHISDGRVEDLTGYVKHEVALDAIEAAISAAEPHFSQRVRRLAGVA